MSLIEKNKPEVAHAKTAMEIRKMRTCGKQVLRHNWVEQFELPIFLVIYFFIFLMAFGSFWNMHKMKNLTGGVDIYYWISWYKWLSISIASGSFLILGMSKLKKFQESDPQSPNLTMLTVIFITLFEIFAPHNRIWVRVNF